MKILSIVLLLASLTPITGCGDICTCNTCKICIIQ